MARGNFGQYALGGVIGLGVVAAAGGVIWSLRDWVEEDIDEAAGVLPADTIFLVAFKGMDSLHADFNEMMSMEPVEENPEIQEALEQLEEELGLDITDMKDLEDTGLDFTGVWAMAAVLDDEKNPMDGGAIYFLVPVLDGDDAADFFIDRLEDSDLEIESQDVGDYDAWSVVIEGNESLAFMHRDDHLVFALDIHTDDDGHEVIGDGVSALEDLVDMEGSLEESESFMQIKEEIGDEWNFFAYMRLDNTRQIVESAMEESGFPVTDDLEPMLKDIEGYEAAAMSWGITREEMSMQSAMLRNDGRFEQTMGEGKDELARFVEGTPLMAFRISYDMEGYWAYMNDLYGETPEYEQAMDEMEELTDLDIEDDIIELFSGDLTLVVLEGSGFIPIHVFGWAKVNDEDDALDLVEELGDMAEYEGFDVDEDEEDGVTWFYSDIEAFSPSLGVGKEHMLFSLFEDGRDELSGSLEDEDDSFLTELPDELSDDFEEGPVSIFWMDIAGIVDALDDVPELRNDTTWEMGQLILAPFQDLISRSDIEGEMMTTEIKIRAAEGDFIAVMEESIEEGLELAEQLEEEMLGYIEPPGYPPPDYEWGIDTGGN